MLVLQWKRGNVNNKSYGLSIQVTRLRVYKVRLYWFYSVLTGPPVTVPGQIDEEDVGGLTNAAATVTK